MVYGMLGGAESRIWVFGLSSLTEVKYATTAVLLIRVNEMVAGLDHVDLSAGS